MASNGLLFDLNVVPDCEDQLVGGDVACDNSEQLQAGICSSEVPCRTVIDVDAFDDDVLSSSWKSFREAKRRTQKRHRSVTDAEAQGLALLASAASITAHDEVVESCEGSPVHFRGKNRKRISVCQRQTFNNQIEFIDLEASPRVQWQGKKNALKPAQAPQQVPATVAPTFCCPICMDNLKTETSTKCGHIFCEECIKKALAKKKWCPVCRKKLCAKDIFRVYLPDVSRV